MTQTLSEIVNDDKELVFMSDDAPSSYTLQDDEQIGFVFPVYWYGLPTVVLRFLSRLTLKGTDKPYVYGFVTYGIYAGNVMNMLEKELRKKNLILQGRFGVKMVDNYVVGYDLPSKEQQKEIFSKARADFENILPSIEKKENTTILETGPLGFLMPVTHYFYKHKKHKHFSVTDSCTGYGKGTQKRKRYSLKDI
ncbi:MAG: EFR1 family ferrodoxin [Lachnospiraceae bacterium]|uniref:EFR1 family ferrodoxin n=1 Tax=Roseburia hominis TaxID=301301 RepID=UPI001F2F0EDD|nr:EFR1 family ferrodoxin [Roseburia hominis]MCI5712224.1 EFR1 family ferrodoxin [Lachnospiraceae bacterium]MDD6170307.1 EFR1 family ferrodoxin [Lachnospiraceae bacterium]